MKIRHLAAVSLEGRYVRVDTGEIIESAASGEAREDMIHAEEQTLLREVSEQTYEIVAAALNFEVLTFGDIEDADVHGGAAGHAAGHLFAEKEVRVAAQRFGAADGIMVGERDQAHAPSLENGVDFARIVIGFTADPLQEGEGAHPRVNGMDVQVAFHRI